jgi:hypothetical protein
MICPTLWGLRLAPQASVASGAWLTGDVPSSVELAGGAVLACAQVGGLAIVSATGLRSCSSGSLLAPQSRIGSRTAIAVDIPSTVELAGGPVLACAQVGCFAIVSAASLGSCRSRSLLASQARVVSWAAIAVDVACTVDLAGGPVLACAQV